ncbi:nonsense-mediated mRNA decay protein 2-like [Pyrus ussuriensis x Pyrus communis]|uniref:Nonsense-mediated mRNA decay protein 2-like n=1 Tax=Pyrus ussuriensis x Pyrus communis TaxID=2448454 RepID=A0A5N5GU17_9ROSA|nr:nonsense-mediated mRNA decay protein 2-like [Pyrus ussuriensis x Pyrus communis]
MAFASALNTPKGLHFLPLPSSFRERPPTNLVLPRHFPTRFSSTLALARRRNHRAEVAPSKTKMKKKSLGKKEVKEAEVEEEDVDEDAIDALFRLLEEDLKNDDASFDEEDLTEEELSKLEQEVAEALGIDGDDDVDDDDDDDEEEDDDDVVVESYAEEEEEEDDDDDDDEDEEEEEEESPVKLKTWQLRRLAAALKVGRRKTSIKTLAAELCLDRAVVLELLREPPPSLLMMCAALPDEPATVISVSQTKSVEAVMETTRETETATDSVKLEPAVKVPVHVRQQKFSAQKRLKKAQVETLESVYRKTKRPTNAMVSSIVHVTNLPRKRVVKWFEDKRSEEGVPDSRVPYQRPAPNTV